MRTLEDSDPELGHSQDSTFSRSSSHLLHQSGDSERAVDLLQAVEVFEGRVQLGHEGSLVHAAAVAGVDRRTAQQIVLRRRVPEQSREVNRGRVLCWSSELGCALLLSQQRQQRHSEASAHLFWATNAWSIGIMLSGQGAVWLGGACCWEKWCPATPMSISGWAAMDNEMELSQ